jgi:hypothetical protein
LAVGHRAAARIGELHAVLGVGLEAHAGNAKKEAPRRRAGEGIMTKVRRGPTLWK